MGKVFITLLFFPAWQVNNYTFARLNVQLICSELSANFERSQNEWPKLFLALIRPQWKAQQSRSDGSLYSPKMVDFLFIFTA